MAELLQTSNLTKAYRKDAPHALKGVSIHISQGRIVGLLIGGICNVTCLYASVVLGQYWKRAKVFGAIVWYVIITTVMGFGALLLFLPKMIQMILNEMNPPADFFGYLFGVTIGVTAVVAIITYLITEHGISKKLNLQ